MSSYVKTYLLKTNGPLVPKIDTVTHRFKLYDRSFVDQFVELKAPAYLLEKAMDGYPYYWESFWIQFAPNGEVVLYFR